MTNLLHPDYPPDSGPAWPHTLSEAVDRLALTLSQAEKDAIAELPESDLIDLHFGLGSRIRNEFGLWGQRNRTLLLDCQRIQFKDMANVPDGPLFIHPDDAAMLIIRALWTRLRH
jgi:hypothetical protein